MTQKESISSIAISSSQQRVLNLQEENGPLYVQCAVELSTEFNDIINPEKLRFAAAGVLSKYDVLRTGYHKSGVLWSATLQSDNSKGVNFEIINLNGDNNYDQYLDYQKEKALSLKTSSESVFNILFLRISDQSGFLLFLVPAVAADSTSLKNIVRDFCDLYLDRDNNHNGSVISYQKFCKWQHDLLQDPGEEVIDFWKKYNYKAYLNVKNPFELSTETGNRQSASKSPERKNLRLRVDGPDYEKLKSLSLKYELKQEVIILVCLNILMVKYAPADHVSIGMVINERMFEELNSTVGLIAKVLPVMVETEASLSPVDLFNQLSNRIEELTEFQDGFDLEKELGENGFFPIGFESILLTEEPGSETTAFKFENFISHTDRFKLKLVALEKKDSLVLDFYFDPVYYNQEAIETIASHYRALLGNVLENPSKKITEYKVVSALERKRILDEFNPLPKPGDSSKLIVELFEDHAEHSPEAIALVTPSGKFTYKEVNVWSNKLAHYLREEYQVKPGDIVGILLDRSEWMIVSVLAILKSGAAYLPIDPEYPKERRKYLLEDSKTQVLITGSDYVFDLDIYQGQLFAVDLQMDSLETDSANPVAIHKSSDLAYVIYTSGSTGLPKGCLIEHHSLYNYVTWANAFYFEDYSGGDFDLFSSLSFDFTITSIFCALTRGRLINIFDPSAAINKILEQSFSPSSLTDSIKLTPSHISLLQYLDISSTRIKKVITGGEALTLKHVEILKNIDPAIEIFNEYGPTEATVGCIVKKVESEDVKVLIGKPIANMRIYILDTDLDVCPIAVSGEIYIAGEGLARGYLNRNELNIQKFISNPFQAGEFLYKTGDTGRWLPDGNIEYLGRNDDQVKINGYRVELGETEQYLLANFQAFKEVTVITRHDKENTLYLAAYIVTDDQLDSSALRLSLAASLPEYMIPRYFVKLDKLPLTVNGKADKNLLPDPETVIQDELTYTAPETPTERSLQLLWVEVLGVKRVGTNDKFLEIGGHSLKAVQMVSRIYKELQIQIELRDIFEQETIRGLAALVDNSVKTKYEKIQPVAEQSYYDLSNGQKRLWIIDQLGEEKSAYHVLGSYQLEGSLNQAGLEWALHTIIDRHEILRTNFIVAQGEPKQKIHAPGGNKFKIDYKDLRDVADSKASASELVSAQVSKAFDLSSDILVRGLLIREEDERYILVMVMHHIISDGWSMEVLVKEFLKLYAAYLKGNGNELTPLRIQYKDYAGWQQEQLSGEHLSASKKYWTEEFSGEIPVLDLPGDRPRPVQRTYNGSREIISLSTELSSGLRSYSQRKGVSLFMSLLAGVKTLLFKYSHQEDIVIGTPVAGRDHYDLEDQMGLYINTLAIRTKFSAEESLGVLIDKVKDKTVAGFNHQQYPFDYLVDSLELEREANRNPIFDVLVALQNISLGNEAESMEGITVTPYQTEQAISKFDLTFNFIDGEQEIRGIIEYNSDLYHKERIERMISHLEQILNKLVEDDRVLLKDLEYITPGEQKQLLEDFNLTITNYPGEKTVQEMFEEQVLKTPEATAIVIGETKLSYKELNERANQLAHYLRQAYAVKADDLIGIMADRDEQMVIGILGILKSGAAYLPVDPNYPDERVRYMLNDGKVKILLSADQSFALKYDLSDLEVVMLEGENVMFSGYHSTNPVLVNKSSDLCYVMYTSGSTGAPKGVAVEHKSVIRLVKQTNYTALNNTHKVLQLSNYVFDGSVFDLYGALLNGAELYLVSKDVLLSNERLVHYIIVNEINITFITTALFNNLVDFKPEIISCFDKIYFGGELASPKHIAIALANRKTPESIVHVYGPTEGTTFSTYHVIESLAANATSVSIGRPVSNSSVFILDQNLQLVPVGISGEIYIGGDGLARGYFGKEELTVRQFPAHPYKAGSRLYKTGDMGRWMEDGTIEFLGRTDYQVKIRGYRIELGEVESVMRECEGIEDVLVIVTESGSEKQLTGYYKSEEEIEPAEVRAYLKSKLPDYMIPSGIIKLKFFPLTLNGKIDKSALPVPGGEIIREVEYHAATNEMEKRMVVLWEEILGKSGIGIKDKFIENGGHSLKAMQLVSRVYKDLNIQIDLKDIFALETIEAISAHLINSTESIYAGIERVEDQEYYELSHGQKRLWILDQLGVEKSAYHVLGSYKLEGELNVAGFEWSLSAIVNRHEILRTSFKEVGGVPKQKVHDITEKSEFRILFKDLRGAEEAEVLAKDLIDEHVNKGFDLTQVPLLRCLLIQTGDQEYIFILVMHHIISDGWSMEILVKEFLCLYDAYLKDKIHELPPLKIQYRDYAAWQQKHLSDVKSAPDQQYWKEEFKHGIPLLNLPGDRPRPVIKTYNGSRETVQLNKELSDSLKKI
ncbi:non-ribosomal peptide synthetase [Pedobacter lusitanus]|uniref:non-ribosomal peptide synthetase n=1 Tax=Pedobacter lusitanus TaxID=1503925 RepID=UPI000698DBCB|nr:non-ribosomal peptide synthetase [Pedobacter lusitanus]